MTEVFEAPWLPLAAAELGVKEIMGIKHNPRILKYHEHTTMKATEDEVAWCSAFACYVIESHGMKSTRSAAARSWLNWGEKLDKPYKGCIVVFKRGRKKWQGHVGFYISENETTIKVLGGNQGNAVSVKSYPKDALLGFRGPRLSS